MGILRRLKYGNLFGLKKYINAAFYDPSVLLLPKDKFDYCVVDGCKFYVSDQLVGMERVDGNPWFDNVRETDICLDVGANIGAVAIPLAQRARKVYALEPLFGDELRANIKLNELKNVKVLDYGLGKDNTMEKLAFSSREGFCNMVSFETLKGISGQLDFVVMDCEGAEWLVEPESLTGVRELRIEFHVRKGKYERDMRALDDWERWLKEEGYELKVHQGEKPLVQFHKVIAVNASKGEGQ